MKTPFILVDNVFDRVNLYLQGVIAQLDPALLLLKYSPGDAIAGESFTRASSAYQIGFGGALNSQGVNTKRDAHWIGGVRSLLLEDTRTNQMLWSNDFSNAAWVKTNFAVATGIADPAGGATACTLTSTGAGNSFATQTLAIGSSIIRTNSMWVRRRTGVGAVWLRDPANTGFTDISGQLSAAWKKFQFPAAVATTSRILAIQVATSGDAIDVWMGDEEDGAFASSEIATAGATATRAADFYSIPLTAAPSELTVYVKFVELGSLSAGARIFEIGSAAGANPKFTVFGGGSYTAFHHNGVASVAAAALASPAIGDTVELAIRLYADGSVEISQSINFGALTTSARSAPNALAAAWAAQLVWLNSIGTTGGGVGFIALQSFKIASGAHTLTEMHDGMSSPSVVGREVNYAVDYRRERSYYQPASVAPGQGLVADLGAGVSQACDSCWIDRGHNLWGKTVKIWAGDDGVIFPTTLSLVVPAQGTVGGDPTTGWCVTEEGALYTLFGGFAARRWWVVTVTDVWQPIITGIILGKRVQLLGYSSVVDEDAGERSGRSEQSLIPGYAGDDRTYSARKVELRLSLIGATEYDSSIRTLRRLLFDINQAAVVCMNYGTAPERTWLYKYQGTAWSSPKTRTLRSATIPLFEYGPAIR